MPRRCHRGINSFNDRIFSLKPRIESAESLNASLDHLLRDFNIFVFIPLCVAFAMWGVIYIMCHGTSTL